MKEGVFIHKDFSSERALSHILYERLIRAPYTRVLHERPKYARIHTAPKASQNRPFMHKAEHTAR